MAKKNVVEAPPPPREQEPETLVSKPRKPGKTPESQATIQGELVEDQPLTVAEYSSTAAALATMREQLANKVWDLTTTKGNEEARQTRLALVRLRTGLDAKRLELKRPHLAQIEVIDNEAKRIREAIEAMEDPLDKLIKADENRREIERQEKAAADARRREAQDKLLTEMARTPLRWINGSTDELQAAIEELQGMNLAELFDEDRIASAEHCRTEAIGHLQVNKEARVSVEARAEEQRLQQIELDRQKEAQQLDNDRVAAIQHISAWPTRAIGKTSAEIAGHLQACSTESITTANFGEREQEALAARAAAANTLKDMHTAALASEAQAAQLATLQQAEAQREAAATAARERQEQIDAQIKGLRALVIQANDSSAKEIAGILDRIDALDLVDMEPYGDRIQELLDTISQVRAQVIEARVRAEGEEQAEAQRLQQAADDRRMRIENATLRTAVVAVLEWDAEDQDDYGLPDELRQMCERAIVNDQADNAAKTPVAVGS